VGGGQVLGRHLDGAGRPVPRAGPTPAVGAPAGDDGQEVPVRPLDEGRGPRPVDVPEEDVHAATAGVVRRATAPARASGVTGARQCWTASGQVCDRHPAQATPWSPSTTLGTLQGAQRCGGTTGANTETTGVPTAAARWAGP